MSLLLGGLLAGAGALLGSAVSGLFGSKATRDTNTANANIAQQNNAFNAEQNLLQYQRTVDLWNMTNEYNTPANQVKRLQEAGLSPYLAYSNAAAGGTASQMSPPSAVKAQNYSYQSPLGAVAQVIGNILPQFLQVGILTEKLKQERINTDALPLILSNRTELLGNQAQSYAANNQFIAPMAYSLLDLRNNQSADYRARWNMMDAQSEYLRMRNDVYKATGLDTAKANLGLLRQRIAAMTFDKQIGAAKLDLLRQDLVNNLLRESIYRKQGDIMDRQYNILGQQYKYNDKYGYGGSHDWLRMLMQTGQGVLQNVADPFKWSKFGTSNIGKYYNQNFYY